MQPTQAYEVVSVKADRTKSGDPMWRCTTKTGESVNVFQHRNPMKDTFRYVHSAGYGELFAAMKQGQIMTWRNHPIRIEMYKDGEWFTLSGVSRRPADAVPDPVFEPDAAKQREKAIRWAQAVVGGMAFVVFDTETTGVGIDDEIISLGFIIPESELTYHSYIRPTTFDKLSANAVAVNGITPDLLASAPTFAEFWTGYTPDVWKTFHVEHLLETMLWVGYNIQFDMRMLERACQMSGIRPPFTIGLVDVMQIVAEYRGEWDAESQRWKVCTLSEAAALFGIENGDAHDALADCTMTLKVLEAIAGSELR